MIRPRGFPGIVFGEAADGDPRSDHTARARISAELGIPASWAIIDQVHGSRIAVARAPGHHGEADGLLSATEMLPIAVATADCVPLVLRGAQAVSVIHAGWRGIAAGVVTQALGLMEDSGGGVTTAVIGPHIGPCCYEVGPEVIEAIGGHASRTHEGGMSADLEAAIADQLSGVEIHSEMACTMCDERFNSFRANGTEQRQVTVAWIPRA